MSGYTYKNRSTGQQVTLSARSARFDKLSANWELLEGPKDTPKPKPEQTGPADDQPAPPTAKPAAKRRPARRQ
jgi:hypothetical protein